MSVLSSTYFLESRFTTPLPNSPMQNSQSTHSNWPIKIGTYPQGLTFHSDQGAQYTAFSFRQLLLDFNVHQSFSDIGNPLDNAVAESFFASLKKEQFKFHFYETVSGELEESLSEYIDFYNDYRPHECLKQQTPNQFEESYQQQK